MRLLASIAAIAVPLLARAAHADAPTPLPACPAAADVKDVLGLGDQDTIGSSACVAGRFGTPRWAIEAVVRHPTGLEIEHTTWLVDAASGAAVVATRIEHVSEHEADLGAAELFAADLDADGKDELIRKVHADHGGGIVSDELVIAAVDRDHLVPRGTVALSFDNLVAVLENDPAAQVTCTSTWSLRRRGKGREVVVRGAITRQPRGPRPTDCPVPGQHAYAIREGKLVRVR